jgi:AI-2 transport protein TqsA
MAEKLSEYRVTWVLIVLASIVVVIFGLQWAQTVVVTFLLSLFIAVIAQVPVSFLCRFRVPAWLAVTFVMLVMMGLIALVVLTLGSAVGEFTSRIPTYSERINQELSGYVERLPLSEDQSVAELIRDLGLSRMALNLVSGLLNGLQTTLGNALLIFFTVVFLLLEGSALSAKLEAAFGRSERPIRYFRRVIEQLKHYLSIKTLISAATGAAVTVLAVAVGLDSPLLWGLLAFLLNYIPNLGSILAAVPAVLLALVQLGAGAAAATGIGFLVINLLLGNFVEPRLMGRGLGLSTLVVFLSLIFWGWVLGPVGMLLSAPLTMTLKLALEEQEETRWLAVLLSSADAQTDTGGGKR